MNGIIKFFGNHQILIRRRCRIQNLVINRFQKSEDRSYLIRIAYSDPFVGFVVNDFVFSVAQFQSIKRIDFAEDKFAFRIKIRIADFLFFGVSYPTKTCTPQATACSIEAFSVMGIELHTVRIEVYGIGQLIVVEMLSVGNLTLSKNCL